MCMDRGREEGRERGREGGREVCATNLTNSSDRFSLPPSPPPSFPSVYMQEYFKAKDFPANMPPIWEAHWGFAKKLTGSAVVIGEWGGW